MGPARSPGVPATLQTGPTGETCPPAGMPCARFHHDPGSILRLSNYSVARRLVKVDQTKCKKRGALVTPEASTRR